MYENSGENWINMIFLFYFCVVFEDNTGLEDVEAPPSSLASDGQEMEPLRRETPRGKGSLKVHKNENFFGFDFEFCTISMLFMHK